MPPAIPRTPEATAPQPSRLSPRVMLQIPAATAKKPITIGTIGERETTGGSAR